VGTNVHDDGVQGITRTGIKSGVIGRNQSNDAFSSLAGSDPIISQNSGVYGQSNQQGVIGLTTSDNGTGVYGGGASRDGSVGGPCIGMRGETFDGAGVQGQSFGRGPAGEFIGNVEVIGNVTAQDISLAGGDCAEEFDTSGVMVDEFGGYSAPPVASPANWLRQAREQIEEAHEGWTVWEYQGGFGIAPCYRDHQFCGH
jgi:hypothetical protein